MEKYCCSPERSLAVKQKESTGERGENGTLIDRASYIAVGTNLANISEWKVIHKDE